MFSWIHPKHTPLIVAHRGSSARAPENTLAAFQQALRDRADAVELDIRMTSDDEIVVVHDVTLDRTTDGRGRVSHRSLSELKSLSAGSWFHRRFSSETIPTLTEVLDLLNGQMGVNIEIKKGPRRQHRRLIEQVVRIIDDVHASRYVMLSSFHYPSLEQVKALNSELTTGVLYHPVSGLNRSAGSLAGRYGATYFICSQSALRQQTVANARAKHIMVGVYTVNSVSSLERAVRAGIDCVITNHPAWIRKILVRFTQ